MSHFCIVTDSLTQFTKNQFPGQADVQVLPFNLNSSIPDLYNPAATPKDLPLSLYGGEVVSLSPPGIPAITQKFTVLGQTYDHVIGIFISSKISGLYESAQRAVDTLGDKNRFHLFDSESISVGTGYLVEAAALAVSKNLGLSEIERLIYNLIPRIYVVFCIPGLSYLYHNKFLDYPQAMIGEMLNLLPTFAIENGEFTSFEKMRNYRHAIDFYQEFLNEFDQLELVTLIQSSPPKPQMTRLLRDHMKQEHPEAIFTECKINLPLAEMLGPGTTGIIAIERADD